MREIGIRRGQTVATNQPVKTRVDPVGLAPIMGILQNHFRTGASDLKRGRLQIDPARETNLMHLETNAVLESDALATAESALKARAGETMTDVSMTLLD